MRWHPTLTMAIAACAASTTAEPAPPAPEAPIAPASAPPPAPPVAEVPPPPMIEAPIPFGDDRKALTLDYLRAHVDPTATDVTMVPRVVVLHWTGGPTVQGAIATFTPLTLQDRPDLAGASALNVSAHFVVDRDGTIYRLMPETLVARHTIGLNQVAVGVENVGGGSEWPLTDAQVDANVALVKWLRAAYPIERVIGHHEYRTLEGTPLFQELDPTYRTEKVDPGDAFMAKVRAQL